MRSFDRCLVADATLAYQSPISKQNAGVRVFNDHQVCRAFMSDSDLAASGINSMDQTVTANADQPSTASSAYEDLTSNWLRIRAWNRAIRSCRMVSMRCEQSSPSRQINLPSRRETRVADHVELFAKCCGKLIHHAHRSAIGGRGA